MNLRKLTTVALAGLALVAAGCSDDDEETGAADAVSAETTPADEPVPVPGETTPPAQTPEPTDGGVAAELDIGEDTDSKPEIPTPSGEPPSELQINDVVEGEGAAAQPGDQLTMQYVGVSFATGEQFDASWDIGQPFPFQLGAGMVIPGWDQGIVGMKEGGRRTLVIPPDLAYGPQGSPPAIGPDETLVFVVDVLEIG